MKNLKEEELSALAEVLKKAVADISQIQDAIWGAKHDGATPGMISKINRIDDDVRETREAIDDINTSLKKGFWMIIGTIFASMGSFTVAVLLLLIKYASASFGRAIPALILTCCLTSQAQTWLAYNAEGRTAATPYQVSGDLVTVNLPTTARKSNRALSFLTQQVNLNLLGGNLGYELELDASVGAWFPTYIYNGVTIPTSVRLWISSSSTPYNFVKVTDDNQGTYWWSGVDIDLADLALFGPVVLSQTLTDPSKWSSALGKNGASIPDEFFATVANARQVGLSFGGYFFDTGCKVANGTATLHVR